MDRQHQRLLVRVALRLSNASTGGHETCQGVFTLPRFVASALIMVTGRFHL